MLSNCAQAFSLLLVFQKSNSFLPIFILLLKALEFNFASNLDFWMNSEKY